MRQRTGEDWRSNLRLAAWLAALALVAMSATGCGSMGTKLKNFLNGKSSEAEARRSNAPRFSEVENTRVPSNRQYKRMNKQRFEEEAEVQPSAGSLWVMEGQGAYLFAQNQNRQVGDILNINIEGAPKTQLQTKVKVISKLLERLDRPAVRRGPAGELQPNAQPAAGGAPPAPGTAKNAAQNQGQNGQQANGQNPNAAQGAAGGPGEEPTEKGESKFDVAVVPARIVEVMRDGSYRVKGSQQFMIGKREYRVIVTGLVKSEDFNEEGTGASRLLDSQFDIVSQKRSANL